MSCFENLKGRGRRGKKHPQPPSAVTASELAKPSPQQVKAALAWLEHRDPWDEVRHG